MNRAVTIPVKRVAILFLDDKDVRFEVFCHDYPDAVFVKTSSDAIQQISGKYWDMVSLDRDLENGDSGEVVVDWIASHRPSIGAIIIHSTNVPRSMSMIRKLREAGYFVRYSPIEVDLSQ